MAAYDAEAAEQLKGIDTERLAAAEARAKAIIYEGVAPPRPAPPRVDDIVRALTTSPWRIPC